MNTLNKILTKIAPQDKTELSIQKVELAKKPSAILASGKKLRDKMKKFEDKAEKTYENYRSATDLYSKNLADIEDKAMDLDDALSDIEEAAKQLDVKPSTVPDYSTAKDLVDFLRSASSNARKIPTF